MKKYLLFILLTAISLTSFSHEVKAQNIGSLQSVVTPGFSFTMDLMLGYTDPDVKELQKVLNASVDTMLNTDEAGSRGKETTYFGELTKEAVIKFQYKYKDVILTMNGQTTASGIVDKATRTQLNLLIGVMNTYNSVGVPESKDSAQVIVPPAPVIVATPAPTVTQPTMSTCQFVELLISIGAIAPGQANQARLAMGCPTVNTFVDLKVNGQNGPISVAPNSTVSISWTSSGVTACSTGGSTNKPLSGSENFTMGTTTMTFTLNCRTASGSALSDSVLVNVTGTPPAFLSTSYDQVGYSLILFSVDTNVPTQLYISYRSASSTASTTASFTTLKSSRAETISGLTPNTTYYITLKIVDAYGASASTAEFSRKTSNDPSAIATSTATSTTPAATSTLTQKVLSLGSQGMVAIAGSETLDLKNKITLEAWVKPTSWSGKAGLSSTTDQVIISKGQIGDNVDYSLSVDNGKLVYSNNEAALWTCSPVIPLNQWTHVAVAIDETVSRLDLFVNGVKISPSALCEGAKGVFNKTTAINKTNAITNITTSITDSTIVMTSNLHIGNFYPKVCQSTTTNATTSVITATSTTGNGFAGYIDDVRIWNIARTETQIKDNMRASVISNLLDLVAEYTFDDGYASDVTYNFNTGSLKGDAEIIEDTTATSAVIAPDFSFGADYPVYEACDAEAESEPDLTAKNAFGGVVVSVNKCTGKQDGLTEVVVRACAASGQANTADIYENSLSANGQIVSNKVDSISGDIRITIRENMQVIPKVGDLVLGEAVADGNGKCTTIAGSGFGETLPASTAEYVGIVTGPLEPKPDTSGTCPVGGGGSNNWFQDVFGSFAGDWGW